MRELAQLRARTRLPCTNRVTHDCGKRVISFFEQLTHLRNYRQRCGDGSRRVENKKRRGIFLFLVGFRPTLDHDRVSRALSLLGRYLHDGRSVLRQGAPPRALLERKVRSMILRAANNVFRRSLLRMNEAGAVIRGTRG